VAFEGLVDAGLVARGQLVEQETTNDGNAESSLGARMR
jgi:hypothetical protein